MYARRRLNLEPETPGARNSVRFRDEVTAINLRRIWWIVLTTTTLSAAFFLFNILDRNEPSFLIWQVVDLVGSAVFLTAVWAARNLRVPEGARRVLPTAYLLFWLVLMDGYYFAALPVYGDTSTYALGVIAPGVLLLLRPFVFLLLLLPNHLVFVAVLAARAGENNLVVSGFFNGTLGVIISALACYFLYSTRKTAHRREVLLHRRTREVRLAESNLRAILENIPFQAWLKDVHGRFLLANGELMQTIGLKDGDITGLEPEEIETEVPLERYLVHDEESLWHGRQVQFERVMEGQDEERWVEVFKSPVLDNEGEFVGIAGLAREITDRKEIEARLAEVTDRALAAGRAKSEFLAAMSHEIRTPMNSVLGYAHLLRGRVAEGADAEYLDNIIKSGELLLVVINDILDFSKIEAGKIVLKRTPIAPAKIAERVCAMFESLAAEKAIDLKVEIAGDVPPWILGDQFRIEQILINLLSNAVKFTERGAVRLELGQAETKPSKPDGAPTVRVEFRVSDTGIGIEKDALERLFKPFSQVDSSPSRSHGGTGLGLVISRRLCKLMNGEIVVDSRPDEGSTFTVRIPFVLPDEGTVDSPPEAPAAESENTSDELSDLRVLVVEDNASNRTLVVAILKRWGINAVAVDGGAAALDLLRTESFDVILMDVQMPEMDGLETTRRIRAYEEEQGDRIPHHHIIALTAFAMREDREHCMEAGMDDYVSKPIQPDVLREALAKAGAADVR